MTDGPFTAALRELDAQGLRRTLRSPTGIDLSSNDYLGLAVHPAVREALIGALQAGTPTGSAGSRLLSGQHPAWTALEARFAAWQGAPAALYLSTGFAANTGVIAALAGPDDTVISDALNHASLIDGARLSRARRQIVPHLDLDAVEQALRSSEGRRYVVVESIYSMDGDAPDLVALSVLCAHHGATLVVDEAHATGLYGPTGQGRARELDLPPLISVHPCGKALGQSGAFICGSVDTIDWLIQRCRPFVFSTAPAPFLAAGLHAALDVIHTSPALRQRPRASGARLRAALAGRVDTGASCSHIVPLLLGETRRALAFQDALGERGWFARAIRPPTVPEGRSRVRLVLRAALSDAQIDDLAADILDIASGPG